MAVLNFLVLMKWKILERLIIIISDVLGSLFNTMNVFNP